MNSIIAKKSTYFQYNQVAVGVMVTSKIKTPIPGHRGIMQYARRLLCQKIWIFPTRPSFKIQPMRKKYELFYNSSNDFYF
jgi:hypothetical protein